MNWMLDIDTGVIPLTDLGWIILIGIFIFIITEIIFFIWIRTEKKTRKEPIWFFVLAVKGMSFISSWIILAVLGLLIIFLPAVILTVGIGGIIALYMLSNIWIFKKFGKEETEEEFKKREKEEKRERNNRRSKKNGFKVGDKIVSYKLLDKGAKFKITGIDSSGDLTLKVVKSDRDGFKKVGKTYFEFDSKKYRKIQKRKRKKPRGKK